MAKKLSLFLAFFPSRYFYYYCYLYITVVPDPSTVVSRHSILQEIKEEWLP